MLTPRLSGVSSTPVTVSWHTVDGTAVAGKDCVAARGTVTSPAGQLTLSVPICVIGDRVKETNETFAVVLTAASGATLGTATTESPVTSQGRGAAETAVGGGKGRRGCRWR